MSLTLYTNIFFLSVNWFASFHQLIFFHVLPHVNYICVLYKVEKLTFLTHWARESSAYLSHDCHIRGIDDPGLPLHAQICCVREVHQGHLRYEDRAN